MRDPREDLIREFLRATGWSMAERRPLAQDASFRRYERLTEGVRRAMLMDAPPRMEDVRPFVRIGSHLKKLGFSAPEILAEEVEAGLLLLEDFGDDTFTRLLASGADERGLYALAVDTLIAIHGCQLAASVEVPSYDDQRLLEEAALLTGWYLPAVKGRAATPEESESYVAAWREVLPRVRNAPETLVLRDYHVDNLMRLADRAGVAACGLLDFQDALKGPASYDLVSLLEDARRDIDPLLVQEMLDRYCQGLCGIDRAGFMESFHVLGAQRHAKVIGIFTRLSRRDGKPQYLRHIPRLWRLLEAGLNDPLLRPVRAWFDRHLPPAQRRIPEAS